jgi:hypothetical protein
MKRYKFERSQGIQHRVPSDRVREHVDTLLATGMTKTAIAVAAGIPAGCLGEYLRRPRLHRDTEARILAVTPTTRPADARPHRILAAGSARRLQALAALGWPLPEISARLSTSFAALRTIRDGRYVNVLSTIADEITTVYEALAMTAGPSQESRRAALRNGWAPPLAWDDESIDDPTVGPLGLAPDAHPATIAFALGHPAGEVAAVLGVSESTVRKLAGRHQAPRGGLDTLVEDWHDTWDYHLGDMPVAAARLGTTQEALHQQLCRAQRAGLHVRRAEVAA